MASSSLPLLPLSVFLLLLVLSGSDKRRYYCLAKWYDGWNIQMAQATKTWCVAKPSSDDAALVANINYACSQVDCSMLQKGKTCFYPDSLINHASVAMNAYYQSRGRNSWNCFFNNSGLVSITNPSVGACVY